MTKYGQWIDTQLHKIGMGRKGVAAGMVAGFVLAAVVFHYV